MKSITVYLYASILKKKLYYIYQKDHNPNFTFLNHYFKSFYLFICAKKWDFVNVLVVNYLQLQSVKCNTNVVGLREIKRIYCRASRELQ